MAEQTKRGKKRLEQFENALRRYDHIEGNGGSHKRNKAKTTVKPKRINGSWGLQYKKTF